MKLVVVLVCLAVVVYFLWLRPGGHAHIDVPATVAKDVPASADVCLHSQHRPEVAAFLKAHPDDPAAPRVRAHLLTLIQAQCPSPLGALGSEELTTFFAQLKGTAVSVSFVLSNPEHDIDMTPLKPKLMASLAQGLQAYGLHPVESGGAGALIVFAGQVSYDQKAIYVGQTGALNGCHPVSVHLTMDLMAQGRSVWQGSYQGDTGVNISAATTDRKSLADLAFTQVAGGPGSNFLELTH